MIFESFLLSVNVSCNRRKLAYITLNARTLLILKNTKKTSRCLWYIKMHSLYLTVCLSLNRFQ